MIKSMSMTATIPFVEDNGSDGSSFLILLLIIFPVVTEFPVNATKSSFDTGGPVEWKPTR